MSEYEDVLAPVISKLDLMNLSMIDFAEAIRTLIETEQNKGREFQDNTLISFLGNAAKCGKELIDTRNKLNETHLLPVNPPGCRDCIGPCHLKWAHEGK